MRLATAVVFVLMLTVHTPTRAAGETVIVANPSSNISEFSEHEIRAIFLGKITRLPNGKPITVFIQEDGAAHADILHKILNKTDAEFMNHWARRVYAGRSPPPLTLGSDAEVIDHVRQQDGGIGYVGKDAALRSSLKIIYTIP
ncbi:MAG: hypothetical protein FD165_1219 [Gammaproteobacteria bacterium]|nr:MAG: hypothetical protein FD165_1219 [Gammaproteobacteria bacterium]TND07378.1 MAG: hypothetical protein FD120_116 [Gammaproteobacteria bacterium]